MEFHWGATPESNAFFARNPKFHAAFHRLMVLANRTFGREYQATDRLQIIGFNLGERCRTDFFEVLFLAVHGWGIGASKLLRGLYERAVALAYLMKHPEKAERFVNYAAIQEYKLMNSAVELAGENAFDDAMAGKTTVAQIKKSREMVKSKFQVPICRKCHEKGSCEHTQIAFSWDDKGVKDQALDVGKPYTDCFLSAYAKPLLEVHATLASAMQESNEAPEESDTALLNAHAILLMVIRSQNDLFSLGLEPEIEACEKDWAQVWMPPTQ